MTVRLSNSPSLGCVGSITLSTVVGPVHGAWRGRLNGVLGDGSALW